MGVFAISIAFAGSFLLKISFDSLTYVIVFLLVFSLYNLNKKTDLEEDKINSTEKAAFQEKYGKGLFLLTIFSMLALIVLSLQKGFLYFIMVLLPLVFGIIYSVKILPFKAKRIKDLPFVKNIYIAATLGYIHVALPVFLNNILITIPVGVVYIFLFLRMIINTTIFDIRDLKGDSKSGIRTAPVLLGVQGTKGYLHLVNFLSFALLLTAIVFGILDGGALIFIPLFFVSTVYIAIKDGSIDTLVHYELLVDGGESYFIAFLALIGRL
jgi:4-hydroxybenzoate polyprenyltransferase